MTCFEHQWLTAADFYHRQDFKYLIAQELACFDIKVRRGEICLVVLHYLASLVLPSGQMLEILPKVSKVDNRSAHSQAVATESARAWVATMLTDVGLDNLSKPMAATHLQPVRARDAVNFQHHLTASATGLDPATGAAQLDRPWYKGVLALAEQKIIQAAKELPSRYQAQVNNHPQAQGKLNLSAQLKQNWHRPHYLYTEQSQLNTDTALASFLATGWAQLQQLTQTPRQATPTALQGLTPLPATQWQSVYQQCGKNERLQASWSAQLMPKQMAALIDGVHWCWWLLTQGHLKQSDKQSAQMPLPSPALMINMNHAFEKWVLIHLQHWVTAQLPSSRLLLQPSFDWLLSHNQHTHPSSQPAQVIQRLTPDACICDSQGRVTHVIDIKYKQIQTPQQISSSDWQQLAVYQQLLQCKNGWLIYPKTENFSQRLDVVQNINDNMRRSQYVGTVNRESCSHLQQMSALSFDLSQAKLLI